MTFDPLDTTAFTLFALADSMKLSQKAHVALDAEAKAGKTIDFEALLQDVKSAAVDDNWARYVVGSESYERALVEKAFSSSMDLAAARLAEEKRVREAEAARLAEEERVRKLFRQRVRKALAAEAEAARLAEEKRVRKLRHRQARAAAKAEEKRLVEAAHAAELRRTQVTWFGYGIGAGLTFAAVTGIILAL